jgi:hypothetical protein
MLHQLPAGLGAVVIAADAAEGSRLADLLIHASGCSGVMGS